MATEVAGGRVHVQRLRLQNYRSVRECDVALQPGLTFLVGPNGAGKSNILDGLRFVSDALNTSLGQAVRDRGGSAQLIHRRAPRGSTTSIEIAFESPPASGRYSVRLGPVGAAFGVVDERCAIRDADGVEHSFSVVGGDVTSTDPALPVPDVDRLYLVTAANLPVFRPVYDAFATMGFYNLDPAAMREVVKADPTIMLARDGGNVASVLLQMSKEIPAAKQVVEDYLRLVVPGIVGVDREDLGSRETTVFRQLSGAEIKHFSPDAMSDGTLRALGLLVALFQPGRRSLSSLVGIEEPEAGLHPVAAGALYEALQFASERRQIVVTSHSPDLLDNDEVSAAELLVVVSRAGETIVGTIDSLSRETIQAGLSTPGDLLRQGQLSPDDRPPAMLTS
jgi:predicted ATPase